MAFATPNVGSDKYTGYSYEGKQIVLVKQRGGSLKKDYHKNNWVPEEKRIEVATLYAALRDWNQVAELSKMSVSVIRKWKDEPWFQNVVSRVLKDKNDVLDVALSDVIHSCADLIKERVANGDTRVNNKTGEQYKVPLGATNLAMVLGILFDKRQLVRGEATSRTETMSFDRRLENLRDTFERFSKNSSIIDVEEIKDNGIPTLQSPETGQGNEEEGPQTLLNGQGDVSEGGAATPVATPLEESLILNPEASGETNK